MPPKFNPELIMNGLGVLALMAEAVPIFGAPVKASAEALKQIMHYAEQVKNNKEDSIALSKHASEITIQLFAALQTMNDLDSIRPNIEAFIKVLEGIVDFSKERAERNGYQRIVKKQGDAEDIKKWEKELARAYERFNINALLDIHTRTANLQAREKAKSQHELLDQLRPVRTAFYDHAEAAPACLQGTRVELLADIATWMNNPSGETVYWLSGGAGTGKTTIAQSVAQISHDLGHITATFFFSRLSDERRSHAYVIPTLAYQLGVNEILRPAVCAVIDSDHDISHRPVRTQAAKLLSDVLIPLASDSLCVIIVMDALDECAQGLNQLCGGELIPELLAICRNVPFIKLFLSTRLESSIQQLFARETVSDNTLALVLHRDIPKDTVQVDIERYLRDELAKVKENAVTELDFPLESDIQVLVEQADGLFIYARTAVEYIADPYGKPHSQMAALIRADPGRGGGQYARLDGLYSHILLHALGVTPQNRHTINKDLRNVLIALVLLHTELSVESLAAIADVEEHVCARFLRQISAILNYEHDTSEPVRLIHLSFIDYLCEPARCLDIMNYGVNPVRDHLWLTECCLEILTARLRYNICDIRDPSLLNDEVPNLQEQLLDCVSELLSYACRFWAVHWAEYMLSVVLQDRQPHLPVKLAKFCNEHLLHWIEVLSLTGNLYFVQGFMPDLIKIMNAHLKDIHIMCLLSDSHHLMREFQIPITRSALHAYHSAFLGMPKCMLSQTAIDWNVATLVSDREVQWQPERLVLEGHSAAVRAVTCSTDNLHIASGSDDCTVRLWDFVSGMPEYVLAGHADSITCVAFLHGDTQLISGSSDNTLRIWDVGSGAHRQTLVGHANPVTSIALSPDKIVSGCVDGTVIVWDAPSGNLKHILNGHADMVNGVAFSSDGHRIFSGSADSTVQAWDAESGLKLRHLCMTGHDDSVTSIACSSDGSYFASASDDGTLRIWDALSGTLQHTLDYHAFLMNRRADITSMAFSPDCMCVVTAGSSDKAIRVWDASLKTLEFSLLGHTYGVESVTFSPDGSQIISGSNDNTVRVWNARSDAHRHIAGGHTGRVKAVAFSSDGLRVVSGSSDCTVRVWDAVSGTPQNVLTGHTHWVTAVAFSPDNSRIASGSGDGTVLVWDAITGVLEHVLAGQTDWVHSATFSPDGRVIVSTCSDFAIRVWDTITGTLRHILTGHTDWIRYVSFSPDGSQIVSSSQDCTVCVWDTASGHPQHTLSHGSSRLILVAFSSDGEHIIAGSLDHTVRIWQARTGELKHTAEGFDGPNDTLQAFLARLVLSDDLPNVRVGGDDPSDIHDYRFNASQGWIYRCGVDGIWRRMCWFSHERRHDGIIAYSGERVCIGTGSGRVTIIDFSNVIA